MNLKLVYRNRTGMFFTLVMPLIIYVALSVLPIGALAGGALKYSNYVLPGIIAMTIMQGGIYGLAYWLVEMKSRGVIKRFLVTPISQRELVLSLLASRVLVIVLQAVILTIVGVLAFHATFAGNIFMAFIFTLLGGFAFLLVGLVISMFADSYESAAPITTAIGLPLTFLGNIFFPTESLPGILKIVSHVLPITYLADGLRKAYLGSVRFADISQDLLILAAWFAVILAFVLWRFRLEE